MNSCDDCKQARRCDCYDFHSPAENRRFWVTLAVFLAADVALIAFVLWVLK